ncbi:MAG: mediator complex subunit [Geoglossum umbratile]|nr:MAG: mediator complex subunit [Geoglossum umbratile]
MENGNVGGDRMVVVKQEDLSFAEDISPPSPNKRAKFSAENDERIHKFDSSVNSRDGLLPNGRHRNGDAYKTEGYEAARANVDPPYNELPPEIEHITQGYQPIGKLITRLVQETWKSLLEVIDAMSEMPVNQHQLSSAGGPTYLNSHTNSNGANSSPMNVQKKMRLLNFAKHRREQFIKVLVLTQWSRQAADVGKVIDLKVWMDTQIQHYINAGWYMADTKRGLASAKLPNPDLKTALEVLSTGDASWLPDLGYIPPEPLTPRQMLKELREINTLLHLRLNIYEHENLPPYFKTYTISSGRATFVVPEEFEVDVSIADEDPASQLYFIDFRILFSPSLAEIPLGQLRAEIETKANDALKKDGLVGCYNFLHDLVLTNKIHVLRRQALEMVRGKWSETIRLETVRRSLVLQYWLHRTGGKSWVEIGLVSGKLRGKDGVLREDGPSRIGLRWFREGKEVKNPPIVLQLGNLSMEAILKHVIALHTKHILTSIRDKLIELPLYARQSLSLSLSTSSTEPVDSSLKAELTPSRTLIVAIEPTAGRFALQPPSPPFAAAEMGLNTLKDPALEAPSRIAGLRCFVAQEEIESRARCSGWEPLRTFTPKAEDLKRIFPAKESPRLSLFRRKSWSSKWLVGASIGMSGEDWWVFELLESSISFTFGEHFRVPIASASGKATNPSYEFFSRLEKAAAGIISYFVNSRYLSQSHVHHTLRPSSTAPSPLDSGVRVPLFLVRFSSLMKQSFSGKKTPWALDVLKVSYQGLDSDGKVVIIVEAQMQRGRAAPQVKLVRDTIDKDVAFNPHWGLFALRTRAEVGEPVMQNVVERLKRIERLIQFVGVVQRSNLPCERVSLGRIVFSYSSTPPLRADVSFAGDRPMTISLDPGNPHLRIKDFLVDLLNSEGPSAYKGFEGNALSDGVQSSGSGGNAERGGFYLVTKIMHLSLPLLLTIGEIENRHIAGEIYIHHRSADWLQISYRKPTVCKIEIKLRQRRDEYRWYVSLSKTRYALGQPAEESEGTQAVTSALNQLFLDSGEGWMGLKTGISASRDGIADAVRKVDDLVWKIVCAEGERKPSEQIQVEAAEAIEQQAEKQEQLAREKMDVETKDGEGEKAVAGMGMGNGKAERNVVVLDE